MEAVVLPEFQTTYGHERQRYFQLGEKLTQQSQTMQKFFRTGFHTTNILSLSGGNETSKSIFPSANVVHSQGITPQPMTIDHNLVKSRFPIFWKTFMFGFHGQVYQPASPIEQLPVYLWNPLTGVYISSLEEKTGMAIKRTSRYMIPQEAAMSKTGQIHNNSNSVIHIGCWTDRPLSPTVNRYEFGGSIKWNITPDLNIQRTYALRRGRTLDTQCLRIQRRNFIRWDAWKTTRYFSDQLYGDVLVSYTIHSMIFSITTAGSSLQKPKPLM